MNTVVSNTSLFILTKLIGTIMVILMAKWSYDQNQKIGLIGMKLIIFMMLLVVANNLFVITGSATSYGVAVPKSMEYPGHVDNRVATFATIIANGSSIMDWAIYQNNTFDGGTGNIRMIGCGSKCVFAVTDWVNGGYFFIDTDKKVGHVTQAGQVNYSLGYYSTPIFPDTNCTVYGNCNPIYQIGIFANSTPGLPSGFVDSNGDLFLAEGSSNTAITIQKFTRSSDYAQSTYKTFTAGVDYVNSFSYVEIQDMRLDNNGYLHVVFGRNFAGAATANSHSIYSGTTLLNYTLLTSLTNQNIIKILPDSGTNYKNFTLASWLVSGTTVNIYHYNNQTQDVAVCTSCLLSTSLSGLIQLGSYVYVSSPANNLVNRYPTTFISSIGNGFIPGTGAIGIGEIIYTTKTIASRYTNYYNTSNIIVDYSIYMDTGLLSGQFYLLPLNYRWVINLVDPNGVTINHYTTSPCTVDFFTCHLNSSLQYSPPSSGWQLGSWIAQLYEVNTITGHTVLITNSNTFNVVNSTNSTGTVQNPTTPINAGTGANTLAIIDGWTALFGLGINAISKFMFAVVLMVFFMVIGGLLFYKQNALSGAVIMALVPYCFFLFIEYIPSWSMIVLGLVVAIKIGFFR
jgi:hypothetical protein